MKCWNCLKEIPDGTKICRYCESSQGEAPLPDMSPAEAAEMMEFMKQQLGPDGFAALTQVFDEAETFDDVSAAIFSGECPQCGSPKTETCDEVAGIENALVGRCKACCTLYCTECGRIFHDDLVTEATQRCPVCGSTDTDFPVDEDDAVLREFVACHHCGALYCSTCGGLLPEDDEPE